MFPFKNNDKERVSIYNENTPLIKNYGTTDNFEHGYLQDNSQIVNKYPVGVVFILFSKFFESFSANGLRTVLALYLRDSLKYSESFSILTLHSFNFIGQFCPIFGGIIADSYLGNSKTIFLFLFLYGLGWLGLIIANLPLPTIPFVTFLFVSLLLIGAGNGNIRGCITSMGGQQFKVPEQSNSLNRYFTHYIILYNLGILLSKIIPPSVRAETQCFGKADCYLAVFGLLGTSFMLCWVIFLIGLIFYKKEEPTKENIMTKVLSCIWLGIIRKLKGTTPSNISWIYGAVDPFSETFVEDVATYLQILKLYLPLPIYWSLLTQVDSSWTFQATHLNTILFGIKIEPDQTKAAGGILLLLFIFLWQKIFEPILKTIDIVLPPLQSVFAGGICAVISFILAGIVQLRIENHIGPPETVLWQLPQYCMLMMAEVLISIAGLKFAFTQAPESMKSVLTATWFMNNAAGNLIVVFVTEIRPMRTQSGEFFLFAVLMLIGILCFQKIASNYVYRNEEMTIENETIYYFAENQFGSTDSLAMGDYVNDVRQQRLSYSCEHLPT